MNVIENNTIRIAILDLYDGHANQGMRCIREILNQWSETVDEDIEWDEFITYFEQVNPGFLKTLQARHPHGPGCGMNG